MGNLWLTIIRYLVIIIMVVGSLWVIVDLALEYNAITHKQNELCKEMYPSPIDGDGWYDSVGIGIVEEGYMRCCHWFYDDHIKSKECKFIRGNISW